MNNLADGLVKAVELDVARGLNAADSDARERLVLGIYDWVRLEARKRAVVVVSDNPAKIGSVLHVADVRKFDQFDSTDLKEKLEDLLPRLRSMTKSLVFSVVNGRLRADAVGDGDQVLSELAFGSSWFDGHQDIVSFAADKLLRPAGYLLR